LSHEFADLRSTSARILEAPAAAETDWQAYKTAKTALVGHLDRVISETTSRLDRHDVAVADDVDRLSRLGALGLGATVVVALLLALTLGAAFRARMVSLRRGVEQITRGDLSVRIDDREGDEVGTLARTFNQMAGELQLLEDMKSQFVAVASHELRTPLTLIDGYCGILLSKGPLSDWHRERVERIHGQVQELLLLVQDLLDAERLQERALAPVLEPFQPDVLATNLARDFESEARARGLQLKLEVGSGTPSSGLADVRALTRVVRNLLDNAVKYTASGEVRLALAGVPGWLLLTVSDTGCGIAPDELPRIFRRFYQVQGTVRPRRGFGLGLSIVKGLVERNHGTIEATSLVGSGTTFSVRWPIGDRVLQRSAG
jgi:signal transduction histidine kinase